MKSERGISTPTKDQGFTLVELLVTITIMATAMVAVFTGLTVLYRATSVERSNANLDQVVRTYSEGLASAAYAACSTSYSTVALPAGYSTTAGPTITYWKGDNPATFGSTCTAGSDPGIQQFSATIQEDRTGQRQQLLVTKRA
jgi:prepilin-type N-terminal cleavage/methylation domain-containing protein